MREIDIHVIMEQMGIPLAQFNRTLIDRKKWSKPDLEEASVSAKLLHTQALAQLLAGNETVQPVMST